MRALTLIQPMGWAIVAAHKPIENRSRNIVPRELRGMRARVAIHNGAQWDVAYAQMVERLTGIVPPAKPMHVIGAATLTGRIFTAFDPPPLDHPGRRWYVGPYGIEIDVSESVMFENPIPCRGMLGFWSLPGDVWTNVQREFTTAWGKRC